jgi:hypothetical protein
MIEGRTGEQAATISADRSREQAAIMATCRTGCF